MIDDRVAHRLNDIVTVLNNINRKVCKQDDCQKMIDENMDRLWDTQSIKSTDVQLTIVYDNPNGLDYIVTTYNKIQFRGKDIVIESGKNKFSIVNGDCIKRIDVKNNAL